MSEVKKWTGFWLKSYNMNIVDLISKRTVKGCLFESKHYTKKLFDTAKDLYKKDLTAHFGCVNAIEFSSDGNLLFSGGDDRRVLVWNVNDAIMYYTGNMGKGAKPFVMKGNHYSNIFCLAVDDENKRIFSGSNDEQVIVHDYSTGSPIDIFLHDSPVFSISLHPSNKNVFASAADNGKILIYDIRESNADLLCVAKLRTPFHGVMFNPREPSLIATANSKVGIHIWDLRKPREILMKCGDEHSMAVRWNQSGTILMALRNLLPIIIYDPLIPKKKLEFDSGTFFNACTMKSCTFAGDNDEYILSGSDDFNLYMWKIPDPWPDEKCIGTEHLTLTGHRSIVNQVRYNPHKQLIASSGVEKIVKFWSPFPMPYGEGGLDKPVANRHRVLCSSPSCNTSPSFLSHDYSQESVEEDSRMIHLFDSLLRNELDDMTFLPVSATNHLYPNKYALPSKKKEIRAYERLIRRKKKHLSNIFTEKSEEKKLICALSLIKTTTDEPNAEASASTERRQSLTVSSSDDSLVEDSSDVNQTQHENSNLDISADCVTSSSPLSNENYSSSFSSLSTTSNATTSVNLSGDSHLSPERLTSDVGSSSSQSKVSDKLTSSESDDSNETNQAKSVKNKLNNMKDSGINLSDSSDSDQHNAVFKRKKPGSSRNYRNFSKRKRRDSDSSNSSDSEPVNKNKKVEKESGMCSFNNGGSASGKDQRNSDVKNVSDELENGNSDQGESPECSKNFKETV